MTQCPRQLIYEHALYFIFVTWLIWSSISRPYSAQSLHPIRSMRCNSRRRFHPSPCDHKLWSSSAYGGRNRPGLESSGNKAFSCYNARMMRSNEFSSLWNSEYRDLYGSVIKATSLATLLHHATTSLHHFSGCRYILLQCLAVNVSTDIQHPTSRDAV